MASLKKAGNDAFGAREYPKALEIYEKALKVTATLCCIRVDAEQSCIASFCRTAQDMIKDANEIKKMQLLSSNEIYLG